MWQIIDDQGRLWSNVQQTLALDLGLPASSNVVDILVRRHGFVAVDRRSDRIAIRLSPSHVSPGAIVETLFLLLTAPQNPRVILDRFETEWRTTIYPTCRHAVQILKPMADIDSRHRRDDFRSRKISAQELKPTCPLALALAKWRDAATPPDDAADWVPASQRERIVAASPRGVGDESLVIRHIGSGFGVFPTAWLKRAPGTPAEDLPDPHYGLAAIEAYKTALRTKEPVIEIVDAFVDLGGGRWNHSRYRRIILPFAQEGRKLVLGTSVVDPTIDLRNCAA
jgi:hypothetical protein